MIYKFKLLCGNKCYIVEKLYFTPKGELDGVGVKTGDEADESMLTYIQYDEFTMMLKQCVGKKDMFGVVAYIGDKIRIFELNDDLSITETDCILVCEDGTLNVGAIASETGEWYRGINEFDVVDGPLITKFVVISDCEELEYEY